MEEKKLFPDFYLGQDDTTLGLESYVRKQDDKGVWYLVPVRTRWDKGDDFNDDELVSVIKLHLEHCYRVLILHIMPDIKEDNLTDIRGCFLNKMDDNQESEKERLKKKLKFE